MENSILFCLYFEIVKKKCCHFYYIFIWCHCIIYEIGCKREVVSIDGKRLPPSMETHNTGVISALPAIGEGVCACEWCFLWGHGIPLVESDHSLWLSHLTLFYGQGWKSLCLNESYSAVNVYMFLYLPIMAHNSSQISHTPVRSQTSQSFY